MVGAENPKTSATETFKYSPPEIKSKEILDPEVERAKIAKVREIAGLEPLPTEGSGYVQ